MTEKTDSKYTVVLLAEKEARYTVVVPALPGCVTCGDTVEEALAMAKPESTEGRPWGQSLKKPAGAPLNLG